MLCITEVKAELELRIHLMHVLSTSGECSDDHYKKILDNIDVMCGLLVETRKDELERYELFHGEEYLDGQVE